MSAPDVTEDLVDVLDDRGAVIGTARRADVRRDNLRHRTVFIAVVNMANELLVHRRADWKDVWPGAWDIAFGGVVDAGEEWITAASRELAEEAGIRAELHYLGEGAYEDARVREVARVYRANHDLPVTPVDGEVVELAWIALDRLREWLHGRTVCADSIAIVLPRLDAP